MLTAVHVSSKKRETLNKVWRYGSGNTPRGSHRRRPFSISAPNPVDIFPERAWKDFAKPRYVMLKNYFNLANGPWCGLFWSIFWCVQNAVACIQAVAATIVCATCNTIQLPHRKRTRTDIYFLLDPKMSFLLVPCLGWIPCQLPNKIIRVTCISRRVYISVRVLVSSRKNLTKSPPPMVGFCLAKFNRPKFGHDCCRCCGSVNFS